MLNASDRILKRRHVGFAGSVGRAAQTNALHFQSKSRRNYWSQDPTIASSAAAELDAVTGLPSVFPP